MCRTKHIVSVLGWQAPAGELHTLRHAIAIIVIVSTYFKRYARPAEAYWSFGIAVGRALGGL